MWLYPHPTHPIPSGHLYCNDLSHRQGDRKKTMHSTLNRAQAVFGFFTTVALFVAGFAALSVLLFPTDKINTEVSLRDVKVYVAISGYSLAIKEKARS